MGFFNTVSTSFRATKIANRITKSSIKIINELITRGIYIKTHDSIEIIMQVMNNYMFTVIFLHCQNKSGDYKQELIGMIKYHMVERSAKMLSPAVNQTNYKTHEADFMDPDCKADESFKRWTTEWKMNILGSGTIVNDEIEENTSQILIDYLNEKLDLDLSQSTFFKNFIFENLKNNKL